VLFDCQHMDAVGYFTSKGVFCSLCSLNKGQLPLANNTPLKSKARHTRGEMARACQLAYADFKAKLPTYPEDKLLKLARNNAKSYLSLIVAVFIAHPQYFLYLWHSHVAMMLTGVC
jgi:hypothetical protein